MITKKAIEAAAVAISGAPFPTKRSLAKAEAALTAAFAAMPGQAVKVKPHLRHRVTGFRGNPLRVVLSNGDEASVSQKLVDSFASPSPLDRHPDDLAVDRFAAAMKAKLAKKRADGLGGEVSAITPTADLASENEMLRAAIAAYVDSVNGEPEKDIWDTEDGKPSDGADRVSSDWAWKEYDDKKQAAFDALAAALERT